MSTIHLRSTLRKLNQLACALTLFAAAVQAQSSTATQKTDAPVERIEFEFERAPLLETLGAETRATYERMSKIKSGLALSEAVNYKCLACRMTIRPQVFNDIRRGESLITCENCGRILFFRG